MIELPICRWRGNRTIEGHVECFSPKLRHGPNGVREELCLGCYLCNHEPDSTPIVAAMPSAASQAQTFVGKMAKGIAAGIPRATVEQVAERKAICDACEHKKVEEGRERCGLCGCYLRATSWLFGTVEIPGKLELATVACPAGKWPALYPPPEKQVQ